MSSTYDKQSFPQIVKRLAFQSFNYTIGSVGLRIGSFLLLPVLTRYLQPSDYGIITLVSIAILVVGVFLALGLPEAALRLFFDYHGDENKRYLGSVWLFSLAYSSVLTFILYFYGGPVFGILFKNVPFDPYMRIGILTAYFTNFSYIPMIVMRAREQSGLYVTANIATFLLDITLRLYLVVFRYEGALGFLIGSMLAYLAMGIFFIIFMHKQITYRVQKRYLRASLRLSLPLFPSVLMGNVSSTFDRFTLDKYLSLSTLGLYNIGFTIGQVLRLFSSAIKTAWVSFYMQIGVSRPDASEILSRIATYYYAVLVLIGLGVSIFSKEILAIMTAAGYHSAYRLVPGFIAAELFVGTQFIFSNGIMLKKRPEFSPIIAVAGITISILSNLLLIPRLGVYGALYALILTNAAVSFLSLYISQRLFNIKYEWGKMAILTISGGVLVYIGFLFQMDNIYLSSLIHLALVVIWIVFIITACFREESRMVVSAFRSRSSNR